MHNDNTYRQVFCQGSCATRSASWVISLHCFCHPVVQWSACCSLVCTDRPTSEPHSCLRRILDSRFSVKTVQQLHCSVCLGSALKMPVELRSKVYLVSQMMTNVMGFSMKCKSLEDSSTLSETSMHGSPCFDCCWKCLRNSSMFSNFHIFLNFLILMFVSYRDLSVQELEWLSWGCP